MSIRWLRRENARGAHIFVWPEWPHTLSLIDDLGADTIEEMAKTGSSLRWWSRLRPKISKCG
jgi:hypothetical protein